MKPNWCVIFGVSSEDGLDPRFISILLYARSYKSLPRKIRKLKKKYGIYYTDGFDMFIEKI